MAGGPRGRRAPLRGAGALVAWLLALAAPALAQPPSLDDARAAVREGRLEDALGALTRLLEARPGDLEVRKERARVLGWLHRLDAALADYDRVLAVTPRDVEAALGRARVLVWAGRLPDAEVALREARALHPDVAEVRTLLGDVLLRRGQVEAAREALARALALAPDDPAALASLGRARDAAGDAAGARAAREAALAAHERRLARDPGERDARIGRASLLAGLGRAAEALADYERVLTAFPRDVEALLGRAGLLVRLGRLDEAEASARQAVALAPGSAEAALTLGDVLGRRRRFEEAARAYEDARRLAPRAVDPLLGLARLRLWQDDPDGARARYEEAIGLEPGNQDALEGLARLARIPRPSRYRLHLGGRYEALEGRSDWTQLSAVLVMRPRSGTALFAGLDQYHRNDRDDTQITVGGGQRLPGDVTAAGSVAFGLDAEAIARRIYEVELARPLGPAVTPSLRVRHSTYVGDVSATAVSPGLELAWAHLAVLARYHFTHASDAGDGHAGSVRVTLFPEARWSGYAAVAYGRETFVAGTVEEVVRGLDVLALAGGVRWQLREGLAVRLDYELEDRRGSYVRHAIGLGLVVDF